MSGYEARVLGAMLVNNREMRVCRHYVGGELFSDPRLRKIYVAASSLVASGSIANPVTVVEALRRDGSLEEVGGKQFIIELAVGAAFGDEYDAALTKMIARTMSPRAKLLRLCESPIETVMAEALLAERYEPTFGQCSPATAYKASTENRRLLFAQYEIPPYRVDFLLVCPLQVPLVVECDGHAFHQGDPSTWQRDADRDRFIGGLGYRTVRFGGWQIHNRMPEVIATIHRALQTGKNPP